MDSTQEQHLQSLFNKVRDCINAKENGGGSCDDFLRCVDFRVLEGFTRDKPTGKCRVTIYTPTSATLKEVEAYCEHKLHTARGHCDLKTLIHVGDSKNPSANVSVWQVDWLFVWEKK